MGEQGVVRNLPGITPTAPLPRGTVTFLLADLEGSVRLWERDRGAMTAAMARLHAIVDREVAGHGGARPVEQGEGDSFVAAFAGAADALAAALAIQGALQEEDWPTDLPLRARMAVHTGEAQLRDEGNYVGTAISRCGRLRSLAHGGQTLVSPSTYELVADVLPERAGLRDLGLHRLRDVDRPLRVYQLAHPDLDDAFPPLRSLELLTQHLPVPLTSFIGRERELTEIADLLGAHRLLTLTGSGGCGKTRLAIQVSHAVAERHPDGIWFADLSVVRDPGELGPAVAAALGRAPGGPGGRDGGHDPGPVPGGDRPGHQPRDVAGRGRGVVAGALDGRAGDGRRHVAHRVRRRPPVHRSGPEGAAQLRGHQRQRAGGFTLDGAEQLGESSDIPRYEVLDILSALADKSLVRSYWTRAAACHKRPRTGVFTRLGDQRDPSSPRSPPGVEGVTHPGPKVGGASPSADLRQSEEVRVNTMSVIVVPLIVAMTGLVVAVMERNNRQIQQKLDQLTSEIRTVDQRLTSEIRTVDQRLTSEIHAVERKLTSEVRDVERQLQSDIRDAERHLTIRIDGLYGHPNIAEA